MGKKVIILKFHGKEYKLPEGLMNIPFQHGRKILDVLNIEFNDPYLMHLAVVSATLNIKPSKLSGCDKKALEVAFYTCTLILSECKMDMFNIIYVKDSYFKLKSLDNLTVNDYFIIDKMFKENNNDVLLAGSGIVKQLYTPIKSKFKYLRYGKRFIKGFKGIKTSLSFNNKGTDEELDINYLPTGFISSTYANIIEYKKLIQSNYPTIFKTTDEDPNEDTDKETEFGYVKPVNESWGWISVIYSICNDNKIQVDYWMDKPIEEFLTYLSYRIDKNKEEIRELNKRQNR